MPVRKKTISIVTPCFNEEGNIERCWQEVKALFGPRGPLKRYRLEHVFADNASTDRTVEMLRAIARKDRSVKVILNARNFGAMPSIFNAIRATTGDGVILSMPADLQDPPEVIPRFVELWEKGYEVAYGIRAQRKEGPLRRFMRYGHYRLVNALADVEVPVGMGDYILADRRVVDVLCTYDDFYPYVRGMIPLIGFKSAGIEYTWERRTYGKSKANWGVLFDLSFNAIIYFSRLPLRLCLWLGMMVSLFSITFGLYSLAIVFWRISKNLPLPEPGIPTIIIGGAFLFGLNFFFLGMLGEYIGAIHAQVRRGPLVVEKERINFTR